MSRSGSAMKIPSPVVVSIATLGLSWEKATDNPTLRRLESVLPCPKQHKEGRRLSVCVVAAMFAEPQCKGVYIRYLGLGSYL